MIACGFSRVQTYRKKSFCVLLLGDFTGMRYLISVCVLMALTEGYLWWAYVRRWRRCARWIYALPLLAAAVGILAGRLADWPQVWLMSFLSYALFVFVPKCLFSACSVAGRLVRTRFPGFSRLMDGLGAMAALFGLCITFYGSVWGWRRLVVHEQVLTFPDLPAAFDGYTLVQLSDLHIGTFAFSPATVDDIVRRVNALQPDAVLFTGDLVNLEPSELAPFVRTLSELRARDGVFSILGNHDYGGYVRHATPDSKRRCLEELQACQRAMGWQLLRNEHRLIRRGADSLVVVGVENAGLPPYPAYSDLPAALEGLSAGSFQILLSHDPTHWRREVLPRSAVQLTLSGHTHAMQVLIAGFTPSRWTYAEWGGCYREGARVLYVNTGTGSNLPFRFGAWPEITVLRLKRAT